MIPRKKHDERAWLWEKRGVFYKATMLDDRFFVMNLNTGIIILRVNNLTIDSQKNIIKNMHKIKFSLECDA